ncbi:MAG: phytanoyl-CoA dioxygenase family protein [Polyangiales bacterium]
MDERPAYLSPTQARVLERGLRLTAKLLQSPGDFVADARAKRRVTKARPSNTFTELSPHEALAENGFAVFHGLLSQDECQRLATELRERHLTPEMREYTSIDAVNRSASVRELLFEPRIAAAVELAIQAKPKFLQISDIQIDHDHTVWHRDGAFRDPGGLDFVDRSAPYRAVKIILYLESEGAGLAMMPGSHVAARQQHDIESASLNQVPMSMLIRPGVLANRRLTNHEKAGAVVWCASVGDALVFDERMFHRGRRIEGESLTTQQRGRKLTVAFAFGSDDVHSSRLHSYFRYARPDLRFAPMSRELVSRLETAGMALSRGYDNHFKNAPEELRSSWQRRGTDVDALVASVSK